MTERDYQLGLQALKAFRAGDLAATDAALAEMSHEGLDEFVAALESIAAERAHS